MNYASRKDTHRNNRRCGLTGPNARMGPNGQMMGPGNPAGPNMFQNNENGTIGPLTGYGMSNAMGPLGMTTGTNRMGNFMNNINSNKMKHIIAPPKMDYTEPGFFFDQNERNNLPIIMVSSIIF